MKRSSKRRLCPFSSVQQMEHTAQLPKMRFVHTAIFVANAAGQENKSEKKPMTNSSKAQLVERYFFRRQVCVACYFWPKTLDWTRRTQGGKRLHMTEGIINSLHWPNGFRSAPLGSAWITPAHL